MATKIVDAGLAIITNRFHGAGTEPVYIGWGSGTGTTAHGDTTLFTEVAPDGTASGTRTTGTATRVTTNVTNDAWQLTGTTTSSSAGTLGITNAGCWDNATIGSGTLFLKGDFSVINLSNGDSIAFTIKTTYVSG